MLKAKNIGMLAVGMLIVFTAFILVNNASGDEWSGDTILSLNDINTVSRNPKVVSSGEEVQVVWMDQDNNIWDIYYINSSNNGEDWTWEYKITDGASSSEYPDIALSGNNLYVVWSDNSEEEYEIYLTKKSPGTDPEWGKPIQVAKTNSESTFPSIAVIRNEIHIVWEEFVDNMWEIYYIKGTDNDGGITWEEPISLTNNGDANSIRPSIAVSSSLINQNHVHVVWEDDRTGNTEVYYNHSEDGGETWDTSDTLLSLGEGDSFGPNIEIGGLSGVESTPIHVVWYDNSDYGDDNYEIYYKRNKNDNWENEQRITFNEYSSSYASIAMSGQEIYVVWQDNRDDNWELYYTYSKNGGDSWNQLDYRLTNSDGLSVICDIAMNGQYKHVVWHDDRLISPIFEIYYKRSPPFEQTEDPYVWVDSPWSGEEWGGDQEIWWSTENFEGPTTYTFKLSTDDGDSWDIIDTVIKNEDENYNSYSIDFDTTDHSDSNVSLVNITAENETKKDWDQSLEFTIDNTPPVTSDNLQDKWYQDPFNIQFIVDDGDMGSGVDVSGTTYYTTDGSDPTTESDNGMEVRIDESGEYTIKYFSVDDAGNEETSIKTSQYQARLDEEIPIFNSWNIPDVDVDTTDLEVSVEVEDQDELSGMNESKIKMSYALTKETDKDKIKSRYWDDNETNGNLDGSDAKLEIDKNLGDFENYYLYVKCKAYDIAGNHNESISDGRQIIDNTPPYITILQPKSGDAFGDEVEIIFKALNTTSDFHIKYKPRIGDWKPIGNITNSDLVGDMGTFLWNTSEEKIEQNYDYKISVEEKDGKAWNESKMFVIDHSAPDSRPDIKTYWINYDLDISFDPYDPPISQREPSGVNRTYYRIAEGEWIVKYGGIIELTISDEGEQKIEFYSVDNASNKEDIRSETLKIDKTQPSIDNWNIPDITYVSDSEEKFSVEISDDLSGIDVEKLKLSWSIYDDGTLNKDDITNWKDMDTTYSDSKLTGNPKSIDYSEFGDQFLYIMCTVEDNAGNYVELMTDVEPIDRETVAKTWNITIASSVDTDDDDVYYVGKTVEITAKEETGKTGLEPRIMIQSTSQSYTLELLSSDIDYIQATNTYTYEWNTSDLNPADDYVVNITLEDVSAGISKSEILIITLEETFVDFELKDLKFMVGAEEITTAREGDKIDIVVTLLIDGEYNGPTTVEFFKDKPSADNNAFAHEEISNLGTTRTVILNWTILEGFKGKQTIYVVVDRDDLVTETSENNNEVNKDIEITKGPSGPGGNDDDGIPIYLIIIPIGAVAAVGGIFLYIKSREEYEYEDDED